MASTSLIILCVVLISSLSLCAVVRGEGCDPFSPGSVHFIDFSPSTGNYLFRSGSPGRQVEYDNLTSAMIKEAATHNMTLPDDLYIVDFSLLDDSIFSSEKDCVGDERDFFTDNPTLGEFHLHTIHGDRFTPDDFPKDVMEEMAKLLLIWNEDKIPDLAVELRGALETKFPTNMTVVVLIHCEAGLDRTGSVSGAYYMKYQNMTFAEAVDVDSAYADCAPGCHPADWNMHGMMWTCEYNNFVEGGSCSCAVPSNASTSRSDRQKHPV
eukprot:TRINITY_DN11664_c0_g1_i1.p1 TRINITY_DN11664_c0_g1~~TRINITY_DN11664_c0_g1_i1.p1  ORF type:complete len:267 (-),score=38.35 TRINITY_DN11664_c0_g1_i1:12-812(-)